MMNTTTTAVETRKCTRCFGNGEIARYRHVEAGVCFGCNGLGVVFVNVTATERWDLITAEYARRAAEDKARREAEAAESARRRAETLAELERVAADNPDDPFAALDSLFS